MYIINYLIHHCETAFFLTGIFCALLIIFLYKEEITKDFLIEVFYQQYCLWSLGFSVLYQAIRTLLFELNCLNVFQTELAITRLGWGLMGLMAYKRNHALRLALLISLSLNTIGETVCRLIFEKTDSIEDTLMLIAGALMQLKFQMALCWISYRALKKEKQTNASAVVK